MKPRFITPAQFALNLYDLYRNLGYTEQEATKRAWKLFESFAKTISKPM